jgi:hypothetical protein
LNSNRPPKPLALTSSMTPLGRALTMSNHFAGEHRIAGGWMRRFFLFASLAESTSSPPPASSDLPAFAVWLSGFWSVGSLSLFSLSFQGTLAFPFPLSFAAIRANSDDHRCPAHSVDYLVCSL